MSAAATPRLPCVFDARYCTAAAPTISTTKQADVVRAALQEGLLDVRPWAFNEALAWLDVERVHDADYVRAVRFGKPRALAESQGFTWSPGFAEAVARIWAGHVKACRLALTEGIVCHPVSGAHHARRQRGAGFCTFNFLVGAGRALLREGSIRRVAVVDLDAHQGDGTLALVRSDQAFSLFDIAGSSWIGTLDTGRLCYAVARNAAEYGRHLQHLAPWLDRVKPDLVQYQAGADPFEDDPIGGIPGMTADALRERDRTVTQLLLDRNIPTVVNLAGGYVRGVTEGLHLQTIRLMTDGLPRGRPERGK